MSLLSSHLEQISFSAQSIASLPFPPPKIFTNALLSAPDITSLIRDTEPHERALFSVPPPPPREATLSHQPFPDPDAEKEKRKGRRQTVFNVAGGEITSGGDGKPSRAPRRNTAVSAVLGADLNSAIKRTEASGVGKGDLDIEVLLRGAEKLGEVYHLEGARDRIFQARHRYARIEKSVRWYQEKVDKQKGELDRMQRAGEDDYDEDMMDYDDGGMDRDKEGEMEEDIDELIMIEEEEIRELERRKRELEDRVSGMERDLGGLMR